ncbi:alpha/beta fold hydrolase [Mycolicibacterium thermoresistibile]
MPTFSRAGAAIDYTDTGAPAGRLDAPTILFGHGLLFSGWQFNLQVYALRRHYRCLAIDWRGQGASSAAAGPHDMDTLTADAAQLVESLGVAPVHYVGLSMGGFIGIRLAARHPGLLRSLSLLNTSAGPEDPAKADRYRKMARIYRFTGIGPLRRAVLPLMFGPAFLADPDSEDVIDEWERRLRRYRRTGLRDAVLAVANRDGVEDELDAVDVPTLVIGGADDAATPPELSRTLAAGIRGSRLEIIDNCGHSSPLEQPEVVTDLLWDFLLPHT